MIQRKVVFIGLAERSWTNLTDLCGTDVIYEGSLESKDRLLASSRFYLWSRVSPYQTSPFSGRLF